MNITVNGKQKVIVDPLSVQALLKNLNLNPTRVAVELNREILPRVKFTETILADGDTMEIVHFVGGG
jgi:thiamine biosynthesis protein ThiS